VNSSNIKDFERKNEKARKKEVLLGHYNSLSTKNLEVDKFFYS